MAEALRLMADDPAVSPLHRRHARELVGAWDQERQIVVPRPVPVIACLRSEDMASLPDQTVVKPVLGVSAARAVSAPHQQSPPRNRQSPEILHRRELILLFLNQHGASPIKRIADALDLSNIQVRYLVERDWFVRCGASHDVTYAAARVSTLWNQQHEDRYGPPRCVADVPHPSSGT
jgi:hypothetical protein